MVFTLNTFLFLQQKALPLLILVSQLVFVHRVVSFENIVKNDYYTISNKAVTHVHNDDSEYIEIERWEQEYLYHRELTKIPIFALFRKWKAFSVWRKNVRSKKITSCRKALQKNLFIVNPVCIS